MTTQNIIAKVLVFVSNVCRIEVTPELAKLAKPGITLIPDAVLAPRQIKLVEREPGDKFTFPATMKWHRDAFIPAVTREVADDLVARGEATYEEQSLLCYSMAEYLAANAVKAPTARRWLSPGPSFPAAKSQRNSKPTPRGPLRPPTSVWSSNLAGCLLHPCLQIRVIPCYFKHSFEVAGVLFIFIV